MPTEEDDDIREDEEEDADAVFDRAPPFNPLAELLKFFESLFALAGGEAGRKVEGATMDAHALSRQLGFRLPNHLSSFADAFAQAAVKHCPRSVNFLDWSYLHAGLVDRESGGGNFLRPRGPSGVGDVTNRWMEKPPPWAGELSLYTEREGWSDELGFAVPPYLRKKHVYVYEVRPPAWAGASVAGWGYGLGQIDFASFRDWLAENDWKDPVINLDKSAEILREGFDSLDSLRLATAAYNAGIGRIASIKPGQDPDSRTTGGDYSADVIRRASQWGFGGSNIA